jgi:carbon monoxide dehydrogenase subunit G
MELEHSFTVPVSEDRAWDVLLDVERVAPCMPGATLDSVDGDEIKGRIKVKVGPIAMTYAGTARFTERDRHAHVITLEAAGKETRGAGTASATVRSMLEGRDGQTHVVVHTTLNVTGRPAQFGRGVMAEVGGKLIGIFASNLADMLASEPAAPAAPAGGQASADEQEGDLESLNLSVRSYNSLRREGIHTVPGLAARTREELLAIDGIGPASVEEIRQKLADRGLTLSESPASGNGAAGPGAGRAAAEAATPAAAPAGGTSISGAPASAGPRPRAAATAGAGATATEPGTPNGSGSGRGYTPDNDAIDLLSVAGAPVLKRAIPVAAAIAAAALIALRLRIKRRRGRS